MKQSLSILCLISIFLLGCDADKPAATSGTQDVATTPEATPLVMEEMQPNATVETVENTPTAAPIVEEVTPVVQAMSGEQVFKKHCFACHMTGAANAPKIGDAEAWAPRIAKGMDALVLAAINGIPNTAMPAKGTCTSCSEEELQAAIDFMVQQSR